MKNDTSFPQETSRTSQTYRRQNQSAWPACCTLLSHRARLPLHAQKICAVTIVGTVLKPLQIGGIMSNNKIMQFSYFYWKSNEKKAEEKTTLLKFSWWNLPLLRYCVMLLEKMHHGILFDCRLVCGLLSLLYSLVFVYLFSICITLWTDTESVRISNKIITWFPHCMY